jgi:hypothetical protein
MGSNDRRAQLERAWFNAASQAERNGESVDWSPAAKSAYVDAQLRAEQPHPLPTRGTIRQRGEAVSREGDAALTRMYGREVERLKAMDEEPPTLAEYVADLRKTMEEGDAGMVLADIEAEAPGVLAAYLGLQQEAGVAQQQARDVIAEQLPGFLARMPGSERIAATARDAMEHAALDGTDPAQAVRVRLATEYPEQFVAASTEDEFDQTIRLVQEQEQAAPQVNPYEHMSLEELEARMDKPTATTVETSTEGIEMELTGGLSAGQYEDGIAQMKADIERMTAQPPAKPNPDFGHLFKGGN